jgi:beta-xylosidase
VSKHLVNTEGSVRRAILTRLGVSILLLATLAACGGKTSPPVQSFKNPVFRTDFPDPFVLKVGKTYYAYATSASGGGGNLPELRSRDLVHWKDSGDAMPIPALWPDRFWAPVVARLDDGAYVMYYTGHDPKVGKQCVGMGRSKSPAGPFRDSGGKPFLCQSEEGGTIDADVLRDGSNLYLYFKNDGNCCGIPTYIYAQKLSSDGRKLVGKRVRLIYNDQAWEGDVVEAPTMWKQDGTYYLFFSGNHWDSSSYAIGYATCRGPMGPCKEASQNPIVRYHFGGCQAEGPGGETITTDASGQTWILYHAWMSDSISYDVGGQRVLWLDRLDWKDGKPVIHAPSCKAEPGPATNA